MKISNFTVIKASNGSIVSTGDQIAVFHKRKYAVQAVSRFLKTGKLRKAKTTEGAAS